METWHKIERWGSEHPVVLGILVVLAGALILWAFWPSAEAAPAPQAYGPAQQVQGNNDLAMAQLAAQQHALDTAAQVKLGQDSIAADLEMNKLNNQTQFDVAGLVKDVELAKVGATNLASTLSTQLGLAGYQRDVDLTTINANAATTQAQIAANTHVYDTATNSVVALSSIQAQLEGLRVGAGRDVSLASIGAYRDLGVAGYGYQAAIGQQNAALMSQLMAMSGDPNLVHTNISAVGPDGRSFNVNVNPPAIENISYREIFERSNEQNAQGQAIRQYLGIA